MGTYVLRSFIKGSKYNIDPLWPSVLGSKKTGIYLFLLRLAIIKANKSTKKGQFPSVTEDGTAILGPTGRRMMVSKAVCEPYHTLEPFWGILNWESLETGKRKKGILPFHCESGWFPSESLSIQLLPGLSNRDCSEDIAKSLLGQWSLYESAWVLAWL